MNRALSVLAFLASCGILCAQPGREISITRPVWQGAEPQSPVLPAGVFGLDFALGLGRVQNVPAVALFASGRLPGKYPQIYGGRITGAIEAIAIDSMTGRTFHAPAEPAGAVPLSAAMIPDPQPAGPGVAPVTEAETWVNLDLRGHLGLPENAATYHVFLWLDELTSPVRTARIPGTAAAAGHPESARSDAAISWGKTSPLEARRGIVLQAGPLHRVYGSIAPDVFANNQVLTLLALSFRSRNLTWHSSTIPPGGRGQFDFDPASLEPQKGSPPDKVFIVATVGSALSNVVTLE